nr:flavodoxin [Allisonella histaminiformans]
MQWNYPKNSRTTGGTCGGEDLFEIRASEPYTSADVCWWNPWSRCVKEHKDETCRPEIEALPNLSGVDEIWIGYPIWWYTHPHIIL